MSNKDLVISFSFRMFGLSGKPPPIWLIKLYDSNNLNTITEFTGYIKKMYNATVLYNTTNYSHNYEIIFPDLETLVIFKMKNY